MKPQRKDNPSSVFYWKDYENDEGLRVSSLAAQGLWMRLLCVAAKADPYGYILVNGHPVEAAGIARLAGVTEDEAKPLLLELERNGVFSVDRRGRMFSRRMVRDAAARTKAQKNGSKGGNPALRSSSGNSKEKSDPVNLGDNGEVKPPYPIPHSHTPEDKIGGGGSAGASDLENGALIERIAGVIGAPIKAFDAKVVDAWISDLKLTEAEIETIIAEAMATKKDGPPNSLRYFTPAMQRWVDAKTASFIPPNEKTQSQRSAKGRLPPPPTEESRLAALTMKANWLRRGNAPPSLVSNTDVADMLRLDLITTTELKAAGVNP